MKSKILLAFYANKRKIWVDRIVILLIQINGKNL